MARPALRAAHDQTRVQMGHSPRGWPLFLTVLPGLRLLTSRPPPNFSPSLWLSSATCSSSLLHNHMGVNPWEVTEVAARGSALTLPVKGQVATCNQPNTVLGGRQQLKNTIPSHGHCLSLPCNRRDDVSHLWHTNDARGMNTYLFSAQSERKDMCGV